MINDYLIRYVKPSNNVIEYKYQFHLTIIHKGWHCFGPLGHVDKNDKNVLMIVKRSKRALHKINTPLFEGVYGDDKV
jgi:hypothetical protein